MSDEMKLLQALCDALGFLVHVETDYKETREPHFIHPEHQSLGKRKFKSHCAQFIRDEEGGYISMLIDPIVTYKLIKKEDIKGEL